MPKLAHLISSAFKKRQNKKSNDKACKSEIHEVVDEAAVSQKSALTDPEMNHSDVITQCGEGKLSRPEAETQYEVARNSFRRSSIIDTDHMDQPVPKSLNDEFKQTTNQ